MAMAIHLDQVTKKYKLGKIGSRYFSFELQNSIKKLFFRKQTECAEQPVIKALDTVSFSIKEGETVGIIGRNGSGKSTLLKLLAGVTLPTEGYIDIRGKVGSLLDIGIGFQGDLSVRENIFLNGAILGMKRKELLGQFDEIVEFAEIKRFIDTPVKRLSSGLYIRLAFSIAVQCVSDILLVDEILSAADRGFLNKCRSRLRERIASGLTLIMVSHNLDTIEDVCKRTVLLSKGRIIDDGKTSEIVNRYREDRLSFQKGSEHSIKS